MAGNLDSSGHAQRKRLLDHMHQHGFITTITARSDLDVMHPAARIQELRDITKAFTLEGKGGEQ